jgi:hypothetical protein
LGGKKNQNCSGLVRGLVALDGRILTILEMIVKLTQLTAMLT